MAHAIPWDTFFPWIQKDTARARFVSGISKASIEHEHKLNRTGWIACDPLAVAVAIRPELIEEVQVCYNAISGWLRPARIENAKHAAPWL